MEPWGSHSLKVLECPMESFTVVFLQSLKMKEGERVSHQLVHVCSWSWLWWVGWVSGMGGGRWFACGAEPEGWSQLG